MSFGFFSLFSFIYVVLKLYCRFIILRCFGFLAVCRWLSFLKPFFFKIYIYIYIFVIPSSNGRFYHGFQIDVIFFSFFVSHILVVYLSSSSFIMVLSLLYMFSYKFLIRMGASGFLRCVANLTLDNKYCVSIWSCNSLFICINVCLFHCRKNQNYKKILPPPFLFICLCKKIFLFQIICCFIILMTH